MRTRLLIVFLLIFAAIRTDFTGAKSTVPDAATLQLLLQKLTVVGNALYVGAHPDDENTAVLSALSLGRKIRTAYLALNRGEGGQNLIGTEQGDLLGVIRTHELLAARNVDDAEQFFTRAVDFGFSKSAEESLRLWGKEEVLADVVWVYRLFRPDIIITRFPSEGETHGHHLASAILAEEAFHAAGDPKRYPDQLKHVTIWKPKRIVWNRYSRGNQTISEEEKKTLTTLEVGEYNRLLGKSYSEIAGISRTMHKSQGFGDSQDRGTFTQYFRHTAGDPAQNDLLDGVDLSWNRISGGGDIGKMLEQIARDFDPEKPDASIPALVEAYRKMIQLETNPWVETKKRDVLEAIRACAGLWLEAIAAKDGATPGEAVTIDATAINRSAAPLRLVSVRSLPTNKVESIGMTLAYNQPATRKMEIALPPQMPYSQPYWLTTPAPVGSRYMAPVADESFRGLPQGPSALNVEFVFAFTPKGQQQGPELKYTEPVLFRTIDPVRGEIYRDFVIVPEAALNVQDDVVVFPDRSPKPVRVQAIGGKAQSQGEVRLVLPKGWSAEPASHPVAFTAKDEAKLLTFQVRPGNGAQSGEFRAQALIGGREISHGKVWIDYPHIPVQTLFPASSGRLVRVDLKRQGLNIGYISGPGDAIPEALEQIGYRVTLLSDDDVLSQDLSSYDAILIGIRAYNTRTALKNARERLLDFVNRGGTLVVQYQTSQDLVTSELGPYPFQISRRRVSVENAPVNITNAEHRLMTFPNRITQADFDGWVQERGLYFPDQWAPQYETVFASADPNEPPLPGGILFTRYGKGAYVFTSYSWFRQLPAGVPGAYRIFVNLISAGSNPAGALSTNEDR